MIAKDSEKLCVFDENMKKGIPPTIYKLILLGGLIGFTAFCFLVPVLYKFWNWMDRLPDYVMPLVFCIPAVVVFGKKGIVWLVRWIKKVRE